MFRGRGQFRRSALHLHLRAKDVFHGYDGRQAEFAADDWNERHPLQEIGSRRGNIMAPEEREGRTHQIAKWSMKMNTREKRPQDISLTQYTNYLAFLPLDNRTT